MVSPPVVCAVTVTRSAIASATPPGSAARSSAARMSRASAGSPKPSTPTLRGSSSCVTGDPTASDSAKPPQDVQNRRESGFRASGGEGTGLGWLPPSRPRTHPGTDPQARAGHGQAPALRFRRGSRRPGRRPTGLRSALAPVTGFGGWSNSPPAAPVAGPKRRGQRGRSPPPAPAGD